MKKVSTKKNRAGKNVQMWATKAKRKQRGGFLSLIIAGLVALGMEAGTAAATAAVVSPVISGAVSGASGYAVTKALGGSKNRIRRVRRIR